MRQTIINFISKPQQNSEKPTKKELIKNFKFLSSTEINELIKEIQDDTELSSQVGVLKGELEWRENVRQEVFSQSIPNKFTWGIIPSLTQSTMWKMEEMDMYKIGMLVAKVLFWQISIPIPTYKFSIERPDGTDGIDKYNSQINLKLDKFGKLKIKCIAHGDMFIDNDRNIRSLLFFLKAFEIIAKREKIIS